MLSAMNEAWRELLLLPSVVVGDSYVEVDAKPRTVLKKKMTLTIECHPS